MTNRGKVIGIWTLAALLAVTTLALLARPMAIAWRCYALHAGGARAEAEVVKKLESPTLVLQIADGPRRGEACTAKTSPAHHEALQEGDPLAVVYLADRPGDCELVATLENSLVVLWAFTGGVAALLLLLVAGALLVQRSLTLTPSLTSYMNVDAKRLTCPECGGEMAEGYLALLAGLHWRGPGEPIGMPHALSGLPGTVGWRARPRLHAFRCEACNIVTFKYGTSPGPR